MYLQPQAGFLASAAPSAAPAGSGSGSSSGSGSGSGSGTVSAGAASAAGALSPALDRRMRVLPGIVSALLRELGDEVVRLHAPFEQMMARVALLSAMREQVSAHARTLARARAHTHAHILAACCLPAGWQSSLAQNSAT